MSFNSGFSPFETHHQSSGLRALDGALQSGVQYSPSAPGVSAIQWNNPERLTVSFAPDGTRVSSYSSELYSAFQGILSAAQLEAQILKAFQQWARLTNVNVGVVNDNGNQFGVSGLIQGDLRFGDIRIGAIPMDPSVYAVTVRNDGLVAGTWAGDILFNTNAVFNSVTEFYSVALHEAGHALGLVHSPYSTSVMYDKQLNSKIIGADIANIRGMYGFRRMDPYDVGNKNNDSFDKSTTIKNAGSLNGEIPLVVYGDINLTTDIDYFDLQPLSGYTGAVKFEFVSSGISLLRGKMSVFTEDGTLIQTSQSSGIRGSRFSITLPNVLEGEKYHVKIEAADAGLYSTGSYALVTTLNDNLTVDPAAIEPVLRGNYWQLDQGDVQGIFLDPNDFYFNLDLATNDSFATAQDLNASIMFDRDIHYQIQGSFSFANDLDFYTVTSPDDLAAGSSLTITLDTMEQDRLVPTVQVFDSNQVKRNSRTLLNGNGQLVIQIDGVSANQSFFLRASAEKVGDQFDLGNYNLVARFDRPAMFLESFGQGTLNSNTAKEKYHSLYIAEPQMLHLALTAANTATREDAQVWVTIYDQKGKVVFRDLTVPGQTRTAKSVVLRPGSYSVLVSLATSANVGTGNPVNINYQFDGKGVTDPVGPEILSPAQKPFKKAGPNDPNYVYPNNILSPKTFIVVDGQNVPTPPGSIIPPIKVNPNAWYWYRAWLVKQVPLI